MVSELAGEGAMPPQLPTPARRLLKITELRDFQIRRGSLLRRGAVNLKVFRYFNPLVRAVESVNHQRWLRFFPSISSSNSWSRSAKCSSKVLVNRTSWSRSVKRSSTVLVNSLFTIFVRSRSAKTSTMIQIRNFASEKSQGKRRISNMKNRIAVFNRSRVLVNPVFAVFDRDFGSRSSPQRRTREMSAELVNSSLVTIVCSSWSRSSENLSDSRSRSVEILSRVLTACNNNISFSESLTVRPSYDAFAVSSPLPSEPKAPEKDSELYPQWKRCDALITLWILRSVTTTIASSVLSLYVASEIWEDLKRRFSESDAIRISDLLEEIYSVYKRPYASTVINRVLDAPTHEFQEVQWEIVVGDDDDNVEDVNMLQDANVGVMDAHSFVWNLATVFGEWKSQYLDDSSQHSGNNQSFLDDSQMKDKTEKEDFNKNKNNKIHEANGWKASLTAVMVKALSDVLFGIGTDLNTSEQKNNDDHFADVSFRSSNGKVHEYDPFSELTFDKPRSAEVRPAPSGSGPKSKQDAEKQSQQIKLCTKVPPSSSKRSCYGGSILQLGTKNIDKASQASVCC
nr:VHS domain-containing protein At3g16270 [Ipomoea trifida]